MSKQMRVTSVVAVVLIVAVTGFVVYVRMSIQHLGFLNPSDVKMLMSAVDTARAAVVRDKACLFTIDESSIGDTRKEAEMLYVAAMLDLYRAKFGTSASSIADLDRLSDFNRASKLNANQLAKDCSVYVDPSGSSVVSCGGARPADADLALFMRSADYVEKFHKVGEHEILYVPAQKCPGRVTQAFE
jgi:hypothetical protein